MKHHEAWPRLDREHWSACHLCDALHKAPTIEEGEAAYCHNCGSVLFRNQAASLDRAVAFGIAALALMVVAQAFPFLGMNTAGTSSQMTLSSASATLMQEGSVLLGILVSLFTTVFPTTIALSLVYICLPLRWGKAWPGSVKLTRWINHLSPWAMVEVFFLGSLVSLMKLMDLAHVTLGAAFWALAGVMFCLSAALGGIDRRELWDRLEVANNP